jgi:hypothetical protein
MNKLSQYKDNLFASHANMESALEYARMMSSTTHADTDNSLAFMTAVRVVLNTAIGLHQAEMSAANKPLIEMIDARVAAAVNELRSEIDGQVEAAIDDIDLDQKVADYMDNNFDIESALSGTSVSITFD